MDCCERSMKYLLFTVNLIILIFATLVIIGSLYGLIVKPSWLEGHNHSAYTFIVSLVVGIVMMSIAILGIVAAMREVKCMLLTYSIIVTLLLVIGITGNIRQHNLNKEVMETFEKQMENTLQFYNDKELIRNFWDNTQSKYQCCGVNSWEDWETHGLKVPDSCCKDQQLECNNEWHTKNFYAKGCIDELRSPIQHITNASHGISTTLLCLMVLGKISAFVLYRAQKIKQQYSPKILP
ncbi:CD151 antigen [Solenopsis invicta]|uniref:CD151 antigen n=1 Tax=Solenopsis invicta TaxID=13686 RepID=UPI000595B728|nr:CD151 antigen [Solenopsis invicta]XP_039304280.1 CD151 antigen [Solenopsis invicta]